MTAVDQVPNCSICREAPAEIMDIEQGPVCQDCHEALESADRTIAFVMKTNPTCTNE